MAKEYPIVDNVESFEAALARVRAAQKVYATYTQEQVDKIFKAAALAANNMRIPLAKMAVEETGMGVVEDKVIKNHYAAEYIYNAYKDTQTVGVLERDEAFGMMKVAEPIGVVAAVIPTTNPTSTAIFKTLICLKTRNGIIISPHPRAKKTTNKCINIIRETLVREGAPADIIQGIEEPSITLTQELMKRCDLVIATGGRPMVKSAYSSGVPAYGSGAGNATVIIDNTCNTAERQAEAAMNTRISKCSDFGSGCSCDGNLIIHEDVYDGFVAALVKEGAYLANEEEAEKLKAVMWDEAGHRLPNTVAISPQKLAEAAGFEIPADRKFIAVTGGGIENVGKEHFFSSEKLTTLLTLFKYYGEFENALTMMQAMFNVGGKGHSCGIYSFDDDHIHRLGMCAPVSRIMVRQPNNRGNSGSSTNGMPPTSSMGCGTWGGNIVSENICLKHYMNTTWVARPLPEDMPSNEELFGEFNKPDMDVE